MRMLTIREVDELHNRRYLEKLVRFYNSNPSPFNKWRDPVQLLRSINRGSSFVIEDDFTGGLRGAGLCLYHSPAYFEIGADRVIENGFGLQAILNDCRSVSVMWWDPPRTTLFAAIREDNISSIKSYEKTDFGIWAADDQMFYECGFQRAKSEEMKLRFYAL